MLVVLVNVVKVESVPLNFNFFPVLRLGHLDSLLPAKLRGDRSIGGHRDLCAVSASAWHIRAGKSLGRR